MKAGKYNIEDFFSTRNFDRVTIPEIQRDYVWGETQIKTLLLDLNTSHKKYLEEEANFNIDLLGASDIAIRQQFKTHYLKLRYSYNIGFIYAYLDEEYPGQLFLIDGQQRFTTIYLLLLALSVRRGEQARFCKQYLGEGSRPRLNYRVRKASSDFLDRFIQYVLLGQDLELTRIRQQYWFFNEYAQDRTVNAMIAAYHTILLMISDGSFSVSLDYLSNMVEFWYFDTNISEQGEELYIYMNARGEPVKENENIKADLLSRLQNDDEKERYGGKWEEWQDLFWVYRGGGNTSADEGFNEFLRWLLIIKVAGAPVVNDEHYGHLLNGRINVNGLADHLSVKDIYLYILALQFIFEDFPAVANIIAQRYGDRIDRFGEMIEIGWLQLPEDGKYPLNQINLLKLLPVLEYVKLHIAAGQEPDPLSLFRFVRYLYNASRLENVSKNTRETILSGIQAARNLFATEHRDIASLIDINISPTLLPGSEKNKFQLYKLQQSEEERQRFESSFWKAEDFKLNAGDISFILSCIMVDQHLVGTGMTIDQLNEFDLYEDIFEEIFDDPDDLLRRAILTFGEYGPYDGRAPSLNADRFTFGATNKEWIEILKENRQPILELLRFLKQEHGEDEQYIDGLYTRIDTYLAEFEASGNQKDWRYVLIADPTELEYCEKKKICWTDGDTIYLLRGLKATINNFKELLIPNS